MVAAVGRSPSHPEQVPCPTWNHTLRGVCCCSCAHVYRKIADYIYNIYFIIYIISLRASTQRIWYEQKVSSQAILSYSGRDQGTLGHCSALTPGSSTYPLLISCHCKGYMKSAEGVAQQLFRTTLNLEIKQGDATLKQFKHANIWRLESVGWPFFPLFLKRHRVKELTECLALWLLLLRTGPNRFRMFPEWKELLSWWKTWHS